MPLLLSLCHYCQILKKILEYESNIMLYKSAINAKKSV